LFALVFSRDVKKKEKKTGKKATAASSRNRCPTEEEREETKET
jgi:hypothetical protein